MKFKHFLSRYKNTSTSLTRDLPTVDDVDNLKDLSFNARRKIDRKRKFVNRYVDSHVVKPAPGMRPRAAVVPHVEKEDKDSGETDDRRPKSTDSPNRPRAVSAGPPRPRQTQRGQRHSFVEPASRRRSF